MLVDVSVVGELSEHFNDQEDDCSGDVVLHRSAESTGDKRVVFEK